MKKTQTKDSLRNIKKQIVSYISIIIIAMIGVTTYLGIDYSSSAMCVNASQIYNSHNFRDVEIISTLLFTEEDLSNIKNVEGVTDAEPVRTTSAKILCGEKRESVNVITVTERINIPEICEGRLPADVSECAVERGLADKLGLKAGDTVKLTGTGGGAAEFMRYTDFTVVGIIMHPDHINSVVPEPSYVSVTWDAFGSDDLGECFMKVDLLTDKAANVDRYSESYKKTVAELCDKLEATAEIRTALRDKDVFGTADEEIEKNQKLLDDAEKKLADARIELDEKTAEYEKGVAEADSAEQQLSDAKPLLDEGYIELEAGRLQLESGKKELDTARIKVEYGKNELDYSKNKLDSAKAQLDDGYILLEEAKDTIRQKIKSAFEAAFKDDSLNDLITWAKPETPDTDDPSKTAAYLWITENIRINLTKPLEEFFGTIVHSDTVPEKLLVALYDVTEGKPSPKTESGEYDYDAIRTALVNTAKGKAGDYKKLSDACVKWDKGHDQYIDGLEKYKTGLSEYEAGKKQFDEAEKQYADGLSKYNDGLAEYNEKKSRYDDALEQLEEGRAKLEEGRKLLSDGEEKYKDGIAELEEGKAKLAEAKDKVNSLDKCRWVILDPVGNAGYGQVAGSSGNLSDLKSTFALLFVIVGSLVIFATVGKMVDEQRSLVGTEKALGFYSREIFAKYLGFGVSAAAIGIILGVLISYFAVEPFLLGSMGLFYYYDITKIKVISTLPTVIVFIAGVLLAAVSVWFASAKLLREPAVRLMQPKAPGIKKGPGGNSSLPLYSRLILLNMRMDLKRVIVTIVSVAGCCALIVIGITLKSAIDSVAVNQYGKITDYDICVKYDPKSPEDTKNDIENALKEAGTEYVNVYNPILTYRFGKTETAELLCGDIKVINEFYHLNDYKTGKPLYPTNEGVLIQKRVAETYDLYTDSELEIVINGSKAAKVRIAGVFDSYFGGIMVMSSQYYETVFGVECVPDAYLVKLNGTDADTLSAALSGFDGLESVNRADAGKKILASTASSVNMTVVLFIFIAAVMAGVVLMNLTNMYIMQKKRELVIMRVNGFTVKEVIGYVLRETVLTTVIGIVLGIAVGSAAGYRIIRTLEQVMIQFDRRVNVLSWLIAALLTVLFTVIVNVIALRKVKQLKLTDVA
ncbi:MAG: FtsX-like permease family protein [Clostridia bacterium]|nr:FtsX-like permease family protein [Clostridia bacterium]